MIAALIVLAIIIALALLGTYLSQNPAMIHVVFESGTRVEWPLWLFVVRAVEVIIILMIVVKIISVIVRLPAISKRFGKNRVSLKAGHFLQKGMLAMGKGKWRQAEKILAKGARLSRKAKQDAGIFLSIAAQAAQQQGANERRDQYLLEARQLAAEGADTFTAALAEAELHLAANESRQALSILKQHQTLHYDNARLQTLESQAYEQLGEYGEVWRLLKNLKKTFPDRARYQARQVEVAKLLFASTTSHLDDVEIVWSDLPKAEKQDESLILSYVSALITHEQKEKAESVLAKEIRHSYADTLIHAYTQLEIGSSRQRLEKFTGWLHARPDNVYLNYGAAKLAFQSEELEKAKAYAERSIKAQPLPEALALLGKIYEALGQESSALQAYRSSLGMTYAEHQAVSGDVLAAPEIKALTADASATTASEASQAAPDDSNKPAKDSAD